MAPLYPLTFAPIFKERVWGGRELEKLFGKRLPPGKRIGESWEITDRTEGVSVVSQGELAGWSLRRLMEERGAELMGRSWDTGTRFPLLVKLLDAREKLSLQVHPPSDQASALGGEPKTEMWYLADCTPQAELFVGLKGRVTRSSFEEKVRSGTVAECVHRISVRKGDAMFLPSGRLHAIGDGNVIVEIQQNSDTTYRVFDWNRVGLDGKARALHMEPSLQCIDFSDREPDLIRTVLHPAGEAVRSRVLVDCRWFRVDHSVTEQPSGNWHWPAGDTARIVCVLNGSLHCASENYRVELAPGQFALLPASVETRGTSGVDGCESLVTTVK